MTLHRPLHSHSTRPIYNSRKIHCAYLFGDVWGRFGEGLGNMYEGFGGQICGTCLRYFSPKVFRLCEGRLLECRSTANNSARGGKQSPHSLHSDIVCLVLLVLLCLSSCSQTSSNMNSTGTSASSGISDRIAMLVVKSLTRSS